jgi:hypothetical protein
MFQFIHLLTFFKQNYIKIHDRINFSDLPEAGSVTGCIFPLGFLAQCGVLDILYKRIKLSWDI